MEPGEDAEAGKPATVDAAAPLKLRNLTPDAGPRLRDAESVVSPDGKTIYSSYTKPLAKADSRSVLVAVDVASGSLQGAAGHGRHELLPGPGQPGRPDAWWWSAKATPPRSGPADQAAPARRLRPGGRRGGALTPLAHDWDRWAQPAAWLPDGSALLVTADDDGASPVFRISVPADPAEAGAGAPPDARRRGVHRRRRLAGRTQRLRPAQLLRIPRRSRADRPRTAETSSACPRRRNARTTQGTLERVETTAADGARVPAYLALPEGASAATPAPLLLWIHGGPLGSWNAWTWRWNPWLLMATGYAVLLPDPALSTGYGQAHIQRGWGEWGKAPFTDLMAVTDAVVERPDIDETRTAAMGGSFGGYMANWVAGNTDRFKAVVTHASLWALDQFGPTTDASQYWLKEMTEEMALENSPHLHVENISTPMLVIHGDKDYRVPIGEGLRLWYELLSKSQLAADENGETDHRFLYFPDENHWILQPQHAKVWYGVVECFLARNVLGKDVPVPDELGL